MMKSLKRWTYRPEVKAIARIFGLRTWLRRCYFRWARPADGIVRFSAGGVPANFYVRTPGEMRNLDPAGGGQQEDRILQLLIGEARLGDTVLDVGSNVGLFAVLLGKSVGPAGTVIAFEPVQECYEHLLDNVKLNGLINVRVYNVALGDTNDRMKLNLGPENGDATLVARPNQTGRGFAIVEVVRGDSFLQAQRLPAPRLVKVDVEGFEYSVLQGLKSTLESPSCQLLCCEVHPTLLPRTVSLDDIVNFVHSLGFVRTETHKRYDSLHLIGRKGGEPLAELDR